MQWSLKILNSAERYLKKLQPAEQERIVKALKLLLADRTLVDLKPLKGRLGLRLRVGKYRVLILEDPQNLLYIVTAIGSRGDIYK